MQIRESSFGYWSGPPAFLAVAGGAALGIGNSARLPYLMSQHGGLAFLACYVACLLIVGLPLLVAEWALGRWMRDELGAGFARLAQEARPGRFWKWVGQFAVLGAVLILSYYSVIAGWSLGYLFRGASGYLASRDENEVARIFLKLASDPERSLAWHTLFMVVVTVIVSYGFREGIERASRLLMPVVLLLSAAFAVLAARAGDFDGALGAILDADPTQFDWRGAVEALYLAFFTLGLGLGMMMTLGAYVPAGVPLVRMGLLVILADTVFGLLVGGGIMSLVLGAGLKPSAGFVLLFFQTVPQALPDSNAGTALAVLFYAVLFLVTLLAATALLEPITRFLMERYRQTRVFAAVGGAVVTWMLGLGTVLAFSVADNLLVMGRNFYDWIQFGTFVVVPSSAFMVCIFISRVLPRELSLAVWGPREQGLHGAWRFALRYPARLALIVILLHGLGVLEWIADFWGAKGAA